MMTIPRRGQGEKPRMSQGFDYIVVGAGSAGCVLADRLTEDPATRVLLIEAGGRDRSPNIKIPAAFAKQFHTKLDWDFSTEPEPHVDGRSLYVPRGKSLGGSSSMNAMLYVRGRPLDYDLWEEQGPSDGAGGTSCPTSSSRRTTYQARRSSTAWAGRYGCRTSAPPARYRPPPDRRERSGGYPEKPRLQRPRAGRRGDVPGEPAQRPALERR